MSRVTRESPRRKELSMIRVLSSRLRSCLPIVAALVFFSTPAGAASIIVDGTFLNPIGTGLNLTPWADWTAAGITREAAPASLPGNVAVLPKGADLFQRFDGPEPGPYRLTFWAENASPNPAQLVTAVQNPLGGWGWVDLLGILDFEPNSGFIKFELDFDITHAIGTPSELYFSNSYNAPDPNWGLENSINPDGTIFRIANVSIAPVVPTVNPPDTVPAPPATMLLLAAAGMTLLRRRGR